MAKPMTLADLKLAIDRLADDGVPDDAPVLIPNANGGHYPADQIISAARATAYREDVKIGDLPPRWRFYGEDDQEPVRAVYLH